MSAPIDQILQHAHTMIEHKTPQSKAVTAAHFALLKMERLDSKELGIRRFSLALALRYVCLSLRDCPENLQDVTLSAIGQLTMLVEMTPARPFVSRDVEREAGEQ